MFQEYIVRFGIVFLFGLIIGFRAGHFVASNPDDSKRARDALVIADRFSSISFDCISHMTERAVELLNCRTETENVRRMCCPEEKKNASNTAANPPV